MEKLYTVLLVLLLLFALSLSANAQQKDDLKGHPIVGVWHLQSVEDEFECDNKEIEEKLVPYLKKIEEEEMKEMDVTYLVLSEYGTMALLELNSDFSEPIIENVFEGAYFISGSEISHVRRNRTLPQTTDYKLIGGDILYLTVNVEKASRRLYSHPECDFINEPDFVDFPITTKIKLKKTDMQLATLKNHPLTQGAWKFEDVKCELEPKVEIEDEYWANSLKEAILDSYADQINALYGTIGFGENGVAVINEEEGNYWVVNDKTIGIVGFRADGNFANYRIEGDMLELTLFQEEENLDLYRQIGETDLPHIDRITMKVIFRLVK